MEKPPLGKARKSYTQTTRDERTAETERICHIVRSTTLGFSSELLKRCETIEEAKERFHTALQIAQHNKPQDIETAFNLLIAGRDVSKFLPPKIEEVVSA